MHVDMSEYLILPEVSQAFAGWRLVSGWLQDPAGNVYRPEDLRAAFWARAAWAARAGYPGELRFMRQELERRLSRYRLPAWSLDIYREYPERVLAGRVRLGGGGQGPVLVTLDLTAMGGETRQRSER